MGGLFRVVWGGEWEVPGGHTGDERSLLNMRRSGARPLQEIEAFKSSGSGADESPAHG